MDRRMVGDVWESWRGPERVPIPGEGIPVPSYQPMGGLELWLRDLMRNPGELLKAYGINQSYQPPMPPVVPPVMNAVPQQPQYAPPPLKTYEDYVNQNRELYRRLAGGEE